MSNPEVGKPVMSDIGQIELKNGDYILPVDRPEKGLFHRLKERLG